MEKVYKSMENMCDECKKANICQDDMRVLFEFKAGECVEFFEDFKNEVFDLSVYDYFNKYYDKLRMLLCEMKKHYPDVDMSTMDIDLLHKRSHMRSS